MGYSTRSCLSGFGSTSSSSDLHASPRHVVALGDVEAVELRERAQRQQSIVQRSKMSLYAQVHAPTHTPSRSLSGGRSFVLSTGASVFNLALNLVMLALHSYVSLALTLPVFPALTQLLLASLALAAGACR